ncbi:ubiquitin-protein ligase peroxin 10 PWA37_000280 [Arxiozyma heterogenica]|uniref:RING-type E3 ubiquitin transferase n=1 Tax=Arxiozyma heterogenica TaxID=278026 RepID=A0AAN7WK49_9SACH|nr:hypothetical protein RI543_004130 [Kazachstania heterogenica]
MVEDVEENKRFEYADVASIIQSYQKDKQIETILIEKFTTFLQNLKGQYFVNLYPNQINTIAKFIYLFFTVFQNERTLGQEYGQLMYVNKLGKALTKKGQRLAYIISICFGPYIINKILKVFHTRNTDDPAEDDKQFSLKETIDLGINLHLILFYFKGEYSDIWKRIFGMKEVITHRINNDERRFRKNNSKMYKVIGYIFLLQTLTQAFPLIKSKLLLFTCRDRNKCESHHDIVSDTIRIITKIPEKSQIAHVSLEDPTVLPFIPSESRQCALCLSFMVDPSCAPCGHVYCWDCLQNWTNERPECPLCRQKCRPQQIQPLI